MDNYLPLVAFWMFCALFGAVIGQSKGRAGLGFMLGLFLSALGVLIISLMNKVTPETKAAEIGSMPTAFAAPSQAPGGWWPDPIGRHQHRYFDGTRWTEHVSDKGVQSMDPLHQQGQPAA